MPFRSALQVLCSQILKLEQIADELSRVLRNDHAVRLGNALQARCKVWRLADNSLLLRSARTDQIADDYQSRCDAYARPQGRMGLQGGDRSHQLQPRAHGPLGVILMGLRIPEIDQDPVAHVLRYEATKALHGLCNALLVGGK
jgi:hypothetical protein